MGKRKKAGHDGLGRELRRLRGGRTLKQVCEMSKRPPLSKRVSPIAPPTLSLIENGISMPNLDTLYTLSVIYRTPMQRLYEIVGLERMVSAIEVPETLEETKAAQAEAWRAGRWFDVVALSIHAERLTSDAVSRVRWRMSRATGLAKVGLAAEGVQLMLECLEAPELPAAALHVGYYDLAVLHLAAGQPRAAATAAKEALRLTPEDASAERRQAIEMGVVATLLATAEHDLVGSDREVTRALGIAVGHLESSELPLDARLHWRYREAVARRLQGNVLVAIKQLGSVAAEARKLGARELEMSARLYLGRLHRERGQLAAARKALERAENLAAEGMDPQSIFEVAVQSWLLAREVGDVAAERKYLRRCERHLPLVPARTPAVVAFERWRGEGDR